jgi:hypothetical protein
VFVIFGLGVAALWRTPAASGVRVGAVAAAGLVATLVVFNLATLPPSHHPDGGWPAARTAGDRILAATGTADPIVLDSLPVFKPPNAVRFPLVAAGADAPIAPGVAGAAADGADPSGEARLVVLCDNLFESAIGAACGGPAEDARVAGRPFTLEDRFEAAPGRWISVYLPG